MVGEGERIKESGKERRERRLRSGKEEGKSRVMFADKNQD